MDKSRYSRFDTLESSEDLQMLFEVLSSVKDSCGHYACVTPFVIVANPNFEKIKESGFQQYYRESYISTLERFGATHDGVYTLWKQGIDGSFIHPEYHGTEHINVIRFMNALRNRHKSTTLAFNNQCVAIPSFPGEKRVDHITTSFYIESKEENESLERDICEGLTLFKDIFGYSSRQFTPGAGIYSPILHRTLKDGGIDYINVQRFYSYPLGDGKTERKFLFNGRRSREGQRFVVRNCVFEPYLNDCTRNNNAIVGCLKDVEAAFHMNAPAIISTHRVNFVGSLETAHRNDSLKQLADLLREIIKRWPDVEFMDGSQMCDLVL